MKWWKKIVKGVAVVAAIGWLGVLGSTMFSFAASPTGTLDEDMEAGDWVWVRTGDTVTWSMLPDETTIGFIGTAYLQSSVNAGMTSIFEETVTGTAGSGVTTEQTGTFRNYDFNPGTYVRIIVENIDDDNTSAGIVYTITEVANVLRYVKLRKGVIQNEDGTNMMRFTDDGVEIPTLSGTTTMSGDQTFSGTLTVTGAVTHSSTTSHVGAVTNSSTVTNNGAVTFNSALILDQGTNPTVTAEGSVFWDTDDDELVIGDGAARQTIVDTDGTQTLTNKTFAYDRVMYITHGAKIGTTAGWAINPADNLAIMANLPASQTGSTLVVPLNALHLGDTLVGVNLIGQVEADAGTVDFDVDVRKLTTSAADIADASLDTLGSTDIYGDATLTITNTEIDISTADTVA